MQRVLATSRSYAKLLLNKASLKTMNLDNIECQIAAEKIKSIDWRRIELFRIKALVLMENWDDLSIKRFSGTFHRNHDGKITSGFSLPNQYRLKGLYADFRHFYLTNSDINLYKHANYLSSLVNTSHFHQYTSGVKNSFIPNSSIVSLKHDGEQITSDELLKTYFNAEFFHTDIEKIERIKKWRELLSEETAKSAIFECVMNSIYSVQNLYVSTLDLSSSHLYLNCPKSLDQWN